MPVILPLVVFSAKAVATGVIGTSATRYLLKPDYTLDAEKLDALDKKMELLELDDGYGDHIPYADTTEDGDWLLQERELPDFKRETAPEWIAQTNSRAVSEARLARVEELVAYQPMAKTPTIQAPPTEEGKKKKKSRKTKETGWSELAKKFGAKDAVAPSPPAPPLELVSQEAHDRVVEENKRIQDAREHVAGVTIRWKKAEATGLSRRLIKKHTRRFRRAPYTRHLIALSRAKFCAVAPPKPSEATVKAIQIFIRREMVDHGVRSRHQAIITPEVVRQVFLPTREMIEAAQLDLCPLAVGRRHEFNTGPSYTLPQRALQWLTGREAPPPSFSA